MSTMSIHLLTISLSPYLRNHLVITISLSQSCRHNLTISPSRLLPLSVTILPSPSRRYHLAVTTFHRPLTSSAIWQTRMSLSVGRKTIKEKNTKPRVRSVPAGSDNYQINFSPNLKRPPLTQLWPNKSNFLGDIFEKCPDRQPVSMCFATASRGLPIARVKPKFLIGQPIWDQKVSSNLWHNLR